MNVVDVFIMSDEDHDVDVESDVGGLIIYTFSVILYSYLYSTGDRRAESVLL